ncbi:MAG: VOC family protein [Acidimicrobiia bacterium]|nr:VOC family protein [Acidimicrobiia bacterium]MDH5520414.1 VOC family protein [Acidimicrobiia bacterium]
MATDFQITFDADDPPALAAFWQLAMGYTAEPPPPGFATWEEFAAANGIPADQIGNYGSAIDPSGTGPRMLFLKVPEGKTAKNRMHLDLLVPDPEAHVARLVEAGATKVETRSEMGTTWTVMLDPEQNEFCVAKDHVDHD